MEEKKVLENSEKEVYERLPEWCKIILNMSTKKKYINKDDFKE